MAKLSGRNLTLAAISRVMWMFTEFSHWGDLCPQQRSRIFHHIPWLWQVVTQHVTAAKLSFSLSNPSRSASDYHWKSWWKRDWVYYLLSVASGPSTPRLNIRAEQFLSLESATGGEHSVAKSKPLLVHEKVLFSDNTPPHPLLFFFSLLLWWFGSQLCDPSPWEQYSLKTCVLVWQRYEGNLKQR